MQRMHVVIPVCCVLSGRILMHCISAPAVRRLIEQMCCKDMRVKTEYDHSRFTNINWKDRQVENRDVDGG